MRLSTFHTAEKSLALGKKSPADWNIGSAMSTLGQLHGRWVRWVSLEISPPTPLLG